MSILNRVPAGVPTGGQFAASEKGESGVALGPVSDRERLTLDDIDLHVGAFPGVGACVANPPEDAAVGYAEPLPVASLAHWSTSMATFAVEFGCDSCRRIIAAEGTTPEPACDSAERCEYRYVVDMAAAVRAGDPFDPVVTYHRPAGHPLRDEQAPGQGEYEVDDGYHRICAHLAAGAENIDALVFHDNGCCDQSA